jgi:hypothetical protein
LPTGADKVRREEEEGREREEEGREKEKRKKEGPSLPRKPA